MQFMKDSMQAKLDLTSVFLNKKTKHIASEITNEKK